MFVATLVSIVCTTVGKRDKVISNSEKSQVCSLMHCQVMLWLKASVNKKIQSNRKFLKFQRNLLKRFGVTLKAFLGLVNV